MDRRRADQPDRRSDLRRDWFALSARRRLLPRCRGLLQPDVRIHVELGADPDAGRRRGRRGVHRRRLLDAGGAAAAVAHPVRVADAGVRDHADPADPELPRRETRCSRAKSVVGREDRHDRGSRAARPAAGAARGRVRRITLRATHRTAPAVRIDSLLLFLWRVSIDDEPRSRPQGCPAAFSARHHGRHVHRRRTLPAAQLCVSARVGHRRHRRLEAGGGCAVARDLRSVRRSVDFDRGISVGGRVRERDHHSNAAQFLCHGTGRRPAASIPARESGHPGAGGGPAVLRRHHAAAGVRARIIRQTAALCDVHRYAHAGGGRLDAVRAAASACG